MIIFLQPAETVDIGTCDQAVPKAYPDKGTVKLSATMTSVYLLIQYQYLCLSLLFSIPPLDNQSSFIFLWQQMR